jgi:hypothetical protein
MKAGRGMNDHLRVSDADREQVASRLRDHYAEGRLSSDELDERLAAALSAKTFAELRHVTADLPDPEPAPGTGPAGPPWGGPRWAGPGGFGGRGFGGRGFGPRGFGGRRRGPRFLPVLLLLLIAALIIPGVGWLLVAFVKVLLLLWLVALVAGGVAAFMFRRHVRRHWASGERAARQWAARQWMSGRWGPGARGPGARGPWGDWSE